MGPDPGRSLDERDLPVEAAVPPEPSFPWRKLSFALPMGALLVVLWFVQLPYFVIGPGPASDVEPLIHVEDHQVFQSEGHLLLTSVHLYQPNAYEVLWAWVDDAQSVVPERDILGPGETPGESFARARSQMDQSQIDATVVALTDLEGYPERHGRGVLVESVLPGSPADGRLFSGDLIVEIDGRAVRDVAALTEMLGQSSVGEEITLTVEAGGETTDVRVAPATIEGIDHPAIGFYAVENFPFPVSIDAGGIGGPSAGLMWTLGLIDILTPGDLTGGRTIAGTGTVDLDGNVGPIGGVAEKVVAAERAGAVVFFAPIEDAPEAEKVADDMVVVPVKTFQEAMDYLEAHPSTGS
jgi:Lon-like protease